MTDIIVVDTRKLEYLIEMAEEELKNYPEAENIRKLIEFLKEEVLSSL